MRVLHVNKYLYRRGGAEGYMLDLVELQRQQGHDVELFGMQHPDNLPELRFETSFPRRVELEPAPEGMLGKGAAAARMVWSTSTRRGMASVLEAFRPDVVHCHNVYHQLSPSVLDPVRRAGIPCVMTLHDYKLACPSYQMLDHGRLCDACVRTGPWQAALRRCKDDSLGASALLSVESLLHRTTRAYAPVDVFVSPSRFLAAVMERAGVFPDRMHVVNHFVDTTTTPTKSEPGGPLTFAGRLSPEKGIDVLIEALAAMRSGATLDVAGDGPSRAALEQLAEARAPGRVRFHGRLAKPELQQLVRRSVATVAPSRWHENQPMTVLESFGAGVPVVASDLGGLPELVRDGLDGLVVPPERPDALAEALDRIVADPEGALRMGARARQRIVSDFTPQRHLERLATVYDVAAGRHQRTVLVGTSR
jgi:glycosyltransferase involved in cell wall biosynthesis